MEIVGGLLIEIFPFLKSNFFINYGPIPLIFISQLPIFWDNNKFATQLLLTRFAKFLLYCTLALYQFNVGNQIDGVEEDRINKPDKPAGIVSIEKAWKHFWFVVILYLIFGFYGQYFAYTLGWILMSYLLN